MAQIQQTIYHKLRWLQSHWCSHTYTSISFVPSYNILLQYLLFPAAMFIANNVNIPDIVIYWCDMEHIV